MTAALDVARVLCGHYIDVHRPITDVRLQWLLAIAQREYADSHHGKALFDDRIVRDKEGRPFVEAVWNRYLFYGYAPISMRDTVREPDLPDDVRTFLHGFADRVERVQMCDLIREYRRPGMLYRAGVIDKK